MPRSKWKPPFVDLSFLKIISRQKQNKKSWSRRSTILPSASGLQIQIHNGQKMINKTITKEMIGHKLGEFAPSRRIFTPPKKKGSTKQKK
ncbi:unnamed protein product [Discosporangium mesarthrocarpum]